MGQVVQKNLVSVVIPTFNRREKVARAVQSVLAQTYPYIEVIVSDDGSTDGTPAKIAELISQCGPKVRYVRSETNHGVSAARNRGIEVACGEYIAFLDSDDTWDPEKIETQLAVAKDLGPDAFVFCSGRVCDASGEQTLYRFKNERNEGRCFLTAADNPLESSIPPPGSWLISSSFVGKVGSFDEGMRTFEDADFAYRVYAAGFKGYFLDKPFLRCHEGNELHLSLMSVKTIEAKELMVKKYHGRLSRKNLARIYNSLAKDYLYFRNRKMASYSLFRAFFTYPFNPDYFGKAFRAWFWIRKRTVAC
ncbi:MAG TPA: glycosyltransferase family 2 protein [Candidatus Bathyarchaeia archaeon]|nr:glycosyltransferase family 2 protein [Candidatus Bathyarchaeia archaeon]